MHKCIICIGSNYNRKENLLLARRRLVDLFPTIRFTSEQETRPLFFRSPALFSNQVAMFFSEAEEERVRKELKAIEQSAGRRPEDKKEEKVSLVIDLLSFDDPGVEAGEPEKRVCCERIRRIKIQSDMKFLGIIPARYASTRFPAKPLAMLGGKTVIQRVYEQVAGHLG